MSSEPIIRAEGLGKRYTLRHEAGGARYRRLSEDLVDAVRRPLAYLRGATPPPSATREDFWALRDVSFDVREGEVLGIIGRNGAGKSTLLKILSRITEPSEGRVTLRGRVASLLEVGTGFHPELTGRENIYLNGAILGMSRAEIGRKFDEIVAFAQVERFLDTPVKRYSSGMYVRLAFAVAAHLEPEILIVDEVLAVGDAEFQKRCLGKMSDVATTGRTILFVTHNMASLQTLTKRSIVLKSGQVTFIGPTSEAIRNYLAAPDMDVRTYTFRATHPHIEYACLSQTGNASGAFHLEEPITLDLHLKLSEHLRASIGFYIRNERGEIIYNCSDEFGDPEINTSDRRTCVFPPHTFNAGAYFIDLSLYQRNYVFYHRVLQALSFETSFSIPSNTADPAAWRGVSGPGLFHWRHSHSIKFTTSKFRSQFADSVASEPTR